MKNDRIKLTLYNKTYKEIDMTDFSSIPEDIFSNRDDIVAVVFPEGVETICSNAFENCHRLEEVVFPESLKCIEKEAFLNCVNLRSAEVGKSVVVSPDAFKGCINL